MAKQLHAETPLVYSPRLSHQYCRDVYLKLESLQPSGNVKLRGIGHMMRKAGTAGYETFICSASGNSALAVAYTGSVLKKNCIVCVPNTIPSFIIERLEEFGAKVEVCGSSWGEADAHARKLVDEANSRGEQPLYVPPFNNAHIWTGTSTIVDEILDQFPFAVKTNRNPTTPDAKLPVAIALPVGGGGGLLNGVCEGLSRHKLDQEVVVLAGEVLGSSSFHQSILNGKPTDVDIDNVTATSIGASMISQKSFEYSKTHIIQPVVVTEQESVAAVSQFLNYQSALIEPSSAIAIAACTALFDSNFRQFIHSGKYDHNHLTDSNKKGCKLLTCTTGDGTPSSQRTQDAHSTEHVTHRFFDRIIPKLLPILSTARVVPKALKKDDGPIVIIITGGSIISPQMLRFYQHMTQTKYYCRRFDVGYSYIQELEARNIIVVKPHGMEEEPEPTGFDD